MSYKYDKLLDNINELDYIDNLTLSKQLSGEWACEDGSSYYAYSSNSDNRNFVNIKYKDLLIKMRIINQYRENTMIKEEKFKIYKNDVLKSQNFCLKEQNCSVKFKKNLEIKKKEYNKKRNYLNKKRRHKNL